MSDKKGKKKEKPVYIDDGRTIADMSGVQGGASKYFQDNGPSYSSFKDKWLTFWDAFRMMLLPTLVVGAAMALLFGVMWLLFKIM